MNGKHNVRVTSYQNRLQDLDGWVSYLRSQKHSIRYHKNKKGHYALWRELQSSDPGHLIDSIYPGEANLERFV